MVPSLTRLETAIDIFLARDSFVFVIRVNKMILEAAHHVVFESLFRHFFFCRVMVLLTVRNM